MHNLQIRQNAYMYRYVQCKIVFCCTFIAQWGHLIVHEVDGLRKETSFVAGCIVLSAL